MPTQTAALGSHSDGSGRSFLVLVPFEAVPFAASSAASAARNPASSPSSAASSSHSKPSGFGDGGDGDSVFGVAGMAAPTPGRVAPALSSPAGAVPLAVPLAVALLSASSRTCSASAAASGSPAVV